MVAASEANVVEDDLRLIVGGNFTPHALGEYFTTVLERVRVAPLAYLDAFERLFIARRLDAKTLSNLHLPSFLDRVKTLAPERARALAQRLIEQYDVALSVTDHATEQDPSFSAESMPNETSRFVKRLDERRRMLNYLLR